MPHEFLLIATAHFVALLSPGQDFLLLVRTALVHGLRRALLASLGIALANALWIVGAILMMEQIRSWALFMPVFRWIGAAVLVWMGWHFLRAGHERSAVSAGVDFAVAKTKTGDGENSFWLGLLSGAVNPKNGLFYASLFSVGVAETTTVPWKIIYGIWMTLVVLVWDGMISALIGNASVRRNLARWQGWVEQAAGGLLILLGLGMALL